MGDLTKKKCKPCEGGVAPLTVEETHTYTIQTPDWKVFEEGKKIRRRFAFKNFVEAMKFVNKVAEIVEEENHHPDIEIHYSKVDLTLWTHAIGGLSENDFIVAAKIDTLI